MLFMLLGFSISVSEELQSFLEAGQLSFDELEILLRRCRNERADMTVGALHTFIHIARSTKPGVENAPTIAQIAEDLELSYPTAARHCDILSAGVRGKSGLHWVRKEPVAGTRQKKLFLTQIGVQVLEEVAGTKGFEFSQHSAAKPLKP